MSKTDLTGKATDNFLYELFVWGEIFNKVFRPTHVTAICLKPTKKVYDIHEFKYHDNRSFRSNICSSTTLQNFWHNDKIIVTRAVITQALTKGYTRVCVYMPMYVEVPHPSPINTDRLLLIAACCVLACSTQKHVFLYIIKSHVFNKIVKIVTLKHIIVNLSVNSSSQVFSRKVDVLK